MLYVILSIIVRISEILFIICSGFTSREIIGNMSLLFRQFIGDLGRFAFEFPAVGEQPRRFIRDDGAVEAYGAGVFLVFLGRFDVLIAGQLLVVEEHLYASANGRRGFAAA